MHLKKGMVVKVISGNHRGQTGKILDVFPKNMKAIVEGVNFRKTFGKAYPRKSIWWLC